MTVYEKMKNYVVLMVASMFSQLTLAHAKEIVEIVVQLTIGIIAIVTAYRQRKRRNKEHGNNT